MTRVTTVRTLLLDAVFGFGALGAVILTATLVWKIGSDLRFFLLVVAAAFLIAAFLRGSSATGRSWIRGLVLAAGGFVPVAALAVTGSAFTKLLWPAAFACTATLAGICGLQSRRWSRSGRQPAGAGLALLCLACVAGATFLAVPLLVARTYAQRVNRAAPAFTLKTLDGKTLDSVSLRGRVTVMAFWATWCIPCRAEYPSLRDIQARYQRNSQVAFFAVDSGGESDTVEQVRAFLQHQGWALPVALDPGRKTMTVLNLSGLPTLIVLDRSGHLRMIHGGYDAAENLESTVRGVVNELLAE